MAKKFDVMISYAWKGSKKVVEDILERLISEGVLVWRDVERLDGKMTDAISRAISDSEIILAVFSEEYETSAYCKAEMEYAEYLSKTIIPIHGGKKNWAPKVCSFLHQKLLN